MCKMYYIGTDIDIPEKKFDEENPKFCIEKIGKSEFDVHTFLSKNIYYIGTSEGCGCKFGTEPIPDEVIAKTKTSFKIANQIPEEFNEYFHYEESLEEIEETILQNRIYSSDTQDLYSLIKQLCERKGQVELLGCWAGTEKNIPDLNSRINLNYDDLQIDFDKVWDSSIKIIFEK